MNSDEFNKMIAALNEQGKMKYPKAATEDQLSLFEKEKKIELPKKYKEWLLFCDGGEFFLPAGIQMYGVAHKPFIDVNESDRPDDSYIVIGAAAWGDPIVYKKGEEQISIYNHADRKIEDDESFSDFFNFLNSLDQLLNSEEE